MLTVKQFHLPNFFLVHCKLSIDSLNFTLCLGLYRRIVSCVLLRSGLGSPTDIAVVREATGIK